MSRLVGDYDGPMTDRFVDFGSNIHDENDEVKKDPAEEKL